MRSVKPKGKRERASRRKTPPPPVCPVHGVKMLVRHVSPTRQYRYCTVPGCRKSQMVERVYRLKNAMSMWVRGVIDAAGRVRFSRGLIR